MVVNARPQKWKEEESERLKGEGDQIDVRFERWQVVGFRKARRQSVL